MMVKKMGAWMLLALLTLVGEWCGSYGCSEEERIGLLEIKALIDPNHLSLGDWVDSSNCCEWPGIECDNTTRRVIQLSLFGARDQSLGDWVLNASLFLPFKELQSLDLSSNGLVGCFENQGFEVQSSKLEVLDLSQNRFNNDKSILSCLSGLSSLKSLDLSDNGLKGSGFKDLSSRLKKLENLDLSWNQYNDSIFSSITGFSSLKSLDLSYNQLTGSTGINRAFFNSSTLEELYLDRTSLPLNFLQNIGALPALKVLSVGECDLNGTLPAQGWCELKNLKQLNLHGNSFGGSLPDCLRNLSSLQLLDVFGNHFTGNINSGPLTNLISLEFLLLSNNHFEVPISMKPFRNHSSLKFFICENNTLIADEPAFHNLIPKFQLIFFSLSYSTLNVLNAEIPNFLYNQYDLRNLDLSHNKFSGMFPSWLIENNTRLEAVYLRENSFVGHWKLQNHPNPNIKVIDISNNNIHGQIPRNMCSIFPNLFFLRMAINELTGCIPSCFGNMSSLALIDLSDNRLSAAKLEQLTTSWFVKLSNNNLGGQIPLSIFNSSAFAFKYLYLDGNNFTGRISDFQPTDWIALRVLDISNNQFSGMLPTWIGNKSFLQAIDLSNNHFEGPVPSDFCNPILLEYLDMSDNNLFGSLPSCFNPSSIKHAHLSENQLSGPLTNAFSNSSFLVTLDLTYNNFMGSISNWIGNLSRLSVLLLKANHFDGEFPTQICLLEELSILDVSQNKLSGHLPSCLGNYSLKGDSEKSVGAHESIIPFLSMEKLYTETMGQPLPRSIAYEDSSFPSINIEEAIEFTTKRMSYGYKGIILNFMSGFDLSSNRFSGQIPLEMGNLSEIHALNLSHNYLTGSIPATFSNLNQIESLDLSHNNLNGVIPPQIIKITTLEVFSVAHNNLSGKTPEMKNQFGTFDESCYEGNPFLCGPPLRNSCSEEAVRSQPMPNDEQEDDGFIDMEFFYISFGACYTVMVMTIVAVLCINLYWRRRWFYFIENCIDTCYYFVVASFRKFSNFRK